MRKALATILSFFSMVIASIFAILFIITTVIVLVLFNGERILLNNDTYKRELVETDIYERLPILVADEFEVMKTFLADPCAGNMLGCAIEGASIELKACLTRVLGEEGYIEIGTGRRKPTEAEVFAAQPCLEQYPTLREPEESQNQDENSAQAALLNNLTAEDWQLILVALLPPEDLRWMVETTIDRLFAFINGESKTASVPLTRLKAQLSGPPGEIIIKQLMAAQLPCTPAQLDRLKDSGADEQTPLELCSPTEAQFEEVKPALLDLLKEIVAKIPDNPEFIKPASAGQIESQENNQLTGFRSVRLAVQLSPILPLVLLLLVALFGARSYKSWLLWWGVPLLIVGVITVSAAIAAIPLLEWAWLKYAIPQMPPTISASLADVGHDFVRGLLQKLVLWIGLEAGVLTLIGMVAVIICRKRMVIPDEQSSELPR